MSILGYPIRGKEILMEVNERNFKKVLFEHLNEESVQFCCAANTLHEIFKRSFSQYFAQGLTNDQNGRWMKSRNGVLVMSSLEYVMYSFDLFEDLAGVDSIIVSVFDDRDRAVYHRNFDPNYKYNKTYILTLDK